MSVFSQISHKVGYSNQTVMLPSMGVATELRKEVNEGNEDAFEAVMRYYRFALSAETDEERLVQQEIFFAFHEGSKKFK